MKKIFLLIALILIYFSLDAQNIKIKEIPAFWNDTNWQYNKKYKANFLDEVLISCKLFLPRTNALSEEYIRLDTIRFIFSKFDSVGEVLSQGILVLSNKILKSDTITHKNSKTYKEEVFFINQIIQLTKSGYWKETTDLINIQEGNYDSKGNKIGRWIKYNKNQPSKVDEVDYNKKNLTDDFFIKKLIGKWIYKRSVSDDIFVFQKIASTEKKSSAYYTYIFTEKEVLYIENTNELYPEKVLKGFWKVDKDLLILHFDDDNLQRLKIKEIDENYWTFQLLL